MKTTPRYGPRALSADDKPRVSDGKFRQPQTATRIARATAGPGFAPEKPTMIRNSSTPPRPVPSRASLQPFLDMRFEIVEVLKVLQVLVDQIPVNANIVVDQYVSKPSQRSNVSGKVRRENLEIAQDEKDVVVVPRLLRIFNGDDSVPHVDQTLDRDLEVSFDDVAEIGLLGELFSAFLA